MAYFISPFGKLSHLQHVLVDTRSFGIYVLLDASWNGVEVIRECGVSQHEREEEVRRQQQEINRRIQRYRQGQRLPSLKDQTVILVDDGIATGATFYASLQLSAISTSSGLSPQSRWRR